MKYLITRTDDFGSASAANRAILKAIENGNYVKNVSCMAAAPQIEAGLDKLIELRHRKDFCVGLHAVLNSEWDGVHFRSILPPAKVPSLVDADGGFAAHPFMFQDKMPDVEEAMLEISAQLDTLAKLGVCADYVDTHMLPEAVVPGLMDALSDWIKSKGLADQRYFYTFSETHQPELSGNTSLEQDLASYKKWFLTFEYGRQYINILHPAFYSEETELFYNKVFTGNQTAKTRDAEQRIMNSLLLEEYCEWLDIKLLKYTDAVPQGDTTLEAVKRF